MSSVDQSDQFDAIADGVVVLDEQCRVMHTNSAISAMSGFSPEFLVGKSLIEFLSLPVPQVPSENTHLGSNKLPKSVAMRSVRAIPEQALTLRCADGSGVAVAVTGRYCRNADGKLDKVFISIRRAKRRLSEPMSGIRIVSAVGHELRSPLTSIKGYTSLLLNRWDRLVDDQKQMMLRQVHHDADRVTRLITELLDISHLETGRVVLRRNRIHVPELVNAVLSKVSLEFPAMLASTEFALDFPLVFADPDKLTQVLTNLVENACKYGSEKSVKVSGLVVDSTVHIAVSDCGPGIAPQEVRKIFTKFYRSSVGRPSGSGLGLWISRGLIEAHGGKLTVSSTLGEGATFSISLPLQDATLPGADG